MSSKTPYIDAVSSSLPSVLSDLLLSFDVFSREKLDTLVRFSAGAACPARIAGHANAWKSGQTRLHDRLAQIEPATGEKRERERDSDEGVSTTNGQGPTGPSKKQKLAPVEDESEDTETLYILHALSVSSPVRKKVDVSITANAIRLTHPSSGALEARIPLAALSRAFLVSSLGKNKNKPQWAVTLISADSVDKKGDAASQVQLTFNIDQSVSAVKDGFKTTAGGGAASRTETHAKGAETLPFLQAFLAHLPARIELYTALGREAENAAQAFTSSARQPYVDAYRGAKEGALCFLARGILWAGARPCEFFPLENLAPDSDVPGVGGVKTLSATGRTFSVFVRRRAGGEEGSDYGDAEEGGEETEFAMIDGRESENVNAWIRKYRRLFGKPYVAESARADPKAKGKAKAEPAEVVQDDDDSDASDDEFVAPSESDGGEPSSDSESSDEDGDSQGDEDEEQDEEEEDGLDPAHHPLMRPGAMPRMSKAAMDAAVAMVTGDLAGSGEGEEEDELA